MALDARRALLLAWADLLPAPTESVRLVVAADDELVWLGAASSPFARGRRRFGVPSIGAARRLAQLDAMGGGEPVLREGWVFLVGTSEWGGELRDVVLPLVSRAVHLTSGSLAEKVLGVVGASPLAAGFSVIEADSEAELVGLVDDPRQRAELLDAAEGAAAVLVGGGFDLEDDPDLRPFRSWCRQVARAAGMRITAEAPFVHGEPHRQLGAVPPGRVRVVVGSGIYAAPATVRAPAASSLARWAALDDLASTAFGHLYPRRAEEDPALDAGPLPSGTVASAYPLTDAQAEVVLRARGAPLTVVSGAPGTGKTHTVAAVALDRAAAGASVLVATRTRAAARAVLEQLARVGVVAVSFGDPRHTEEESPHGDLEGRGHLEGRGALDKAVDRAEALRRTVLASLDRAAAGGQGSGPVRWDELAAAEGAVRAVAAREAWAATCLGPPQDGWGRRRRRVAEQVHSALVAGRGARREQLAALDADDLRRAAPVWVGTLEDVQDLLPRRAGLFDLVVVDEAAHVDQVAAAPALLRGRAALVVGDPRQLRHVSFLAEAAIASAYEARSIGPLADAVNPRRDSLFDRAAALVGPRHLDLHLRSVPHLISFPLRAFYDRPVEVATRRPGVDGLDAIDVVRPPRPGRAAEVAAIVDLLAARLGAMEGGAGGGAATIGVITPFRAHARALEAALAHAFDEASLRALRLRVGTVHEVQGAELDETVLAIGLAAGDPAQRVAFVEDPHLFDVMVTRARRRTTVVTALDPGSTTLLGRYLAHAAGPEPVPPDRSVDDPWAAALAAHLRAVGVPVHLGYAVGPWLLDLVVDDPSRAVAVEARLHPAGATAHLDRHRALVGLGWEVLDARPGVLGDDPAVAALAVAAAVGPAPGGAG